MYWYERENREPSIVLSTRVRFARNLEDAPFPARLGAQEGEKVFCRVKEALAGKNPRAVDFGDVDDTVKEAYVETHLASRALAAKGRGSGLILSREGDVAVMVNEEDHIRLQVILPGEAVDAAYEKALAHLIEKTKAGETFGEWSDYGRLTEE